ncbi:hypothetical protein PMIN06_007386 [Paraphaeosphaeria minitans]
MRLTSVILGACGLGFSTAQSDPLEGYAFLYFTGENIFLAASAGNDASNWTELNGGQPIYKSSYGTKGLRDPFVIRSAEGVLDRTTGKYYLFWGNTGTGQPLYAELADDMVTLKEETLATASGLTKLREGVFVNYRQGLFHMTFDRRHRL